MSSPRESLASRMGFILLSAGCAIGLGNVWRFPFIVGRYGGWTYCSMEDCMLEAKELTQSLQ